VCVGHGLVRNAGTVARPGYDGRQLPGMHAKSVWAAGASQQKESW
jgi:hypothetical protein